MSVADLAVEIDDFVCEDDVEAPPTTISPELLRALREIAPKKRRSKAPYLVTLALMAGAVVSGRNGLAREFVASRLEIIASEVRAAFTSAEGFPQNERKVEPGRP